MSFRTASHRNPIHEIFIRPDTGWGIIAVTPFCRAPLITDDTATQGQGNIQIELITEHGYEHEDGTRENTVNTNVVFTYGGRDDVDLAPPAGGVLRRRMVYYTIGG